MIKRSNRALTRVSTIFTSVGSFILAFILGISLLQPLQTVQAQTISFSSSGLVGESSNNPTSLQFGPDGRLYVAQQDGTIYAYTVQRNAPNDYEVIATETINLVKNGTPNHNDDGSDNGTSQRQVTGLLVTGTGTTPVLYVTSSDSRISVGNDSGLDTNSGVISRLTCTGGISSDQCQSWDKVDIVRGLPRSEENHSTNGMDLDESTNTLFVIQGGHANKGAPGNNFSGTPEYFLSAALLSVDLDAIEAMPVYTDSRSGVQFVYDLRTFDDPSRVNIDNTDANFPYPSGHPLFNSEIDPGDPFGGNNGLNQAIPEPGGPVQVYSPGYRNAFDIVFTENGRLYTSDNGPNGGWGGLPFIYDSNDNLKGIETDAGVSFDAGAGDYCTNEFNENGSNGHGDNLHFISGPDYYGGHPTPIRAFPEKSGVYIYEEQGNNNWVQISGSPFDFATLLPPDLSILDFPDNPVECAYTAQDNTIDEINASTNGITEYTADNFSGAMQGNILTASFNGTIYRYELNAAGDAYTTKEALFSGFGSQPLDVTAQGDGDIFGGTIWAVTYGADNITVFEPADYDGNNNGNCTGADDAALDEDNDNYTNADEIDNGTNPCSGGSKPDDNDGDFVSDLNDNDDDDDGILDPDDSFAIDPDNGTTTNLPVYYPFWNFDPGTGFFGLGFTGLMNNGATDYLDQFDENTLAAGGAAGKITVEQVTLGDAYQGNNSQDNAFQFGVNVDSNSAPFIVHTRVEEPFFAVNGSPTTPQNFQSFGLQIGAGDQDNYLKMVVNANGGNGGIEVLLENNGTASGNNFGPGFGSSNILDSSQIDLYLQIDPAAGTVQPKLSLNGGDTILDVGSALSLPAGWLDANDNKGLAVGIISTAFNSGTPFAATWDFINVVPVMDSGLSADPDTLDFGTVLQGASTIEIVTLSNTGDPSADAIEITSINSDDAQFTTNFSGPQTLNPGASLDVEVTFSPTAVGNQSATLSITHNGANTSPLTVNLSGESIDQPIVTYRINAGGPELAALDSGPVWSADTTGSPSAFHNTGSNATGFTGGSVDSSVPATTPAAVFDTERWDPPADAEMQWDFPVSNGDYEVRLYLKNGYDGTSATGQRIFDVNIEGGIIELDDYDIVADVGHQVGTMKSFVVSVNDGNLDIDFGHNVENPLINAIEILSFTGGGSNAAPQVTNPGDQTSSEGDISNVTVQASDNDGPQNLDYSANGLPPGLDIEPTNGQIFGTIASGAATNSPYNVTVDVSDGEDTTSIAFNWTVNADGPPICTSGAVIYRINSGGPELAGTPLSWSEDQAAAAADTGGTAAVGTPSLYVNTADADKTYGVAASTVISNTTSAPDSLFRLERYSDTPNPDSMKWDFPVANGNYTVNLLFAEVWDGASSPGARVFDVQIEGVTVLDDYDIYVASGNVLNVALEESFATTVGDGNLDIDFIQITQNPSIKGIEIICDEPVVTPVVEITSPGDGATFTAGEPIVIDWATSNADASAGDHVHIYVDSDVFEERYSPFPLSGSQNLLELDPIPDLSPGSHFVTLKVADTTHAEYATVATINFTVIEDGAGQTLYRINVGGPQVAAADNSSPDWSEDSSASPSPFISGGGANFYNAGSGSAHPGPIVTSDPSIPPGAPVAIFETERWDEAAAPEMSWSFPVSSGTTLEVRLFFAELFSGVDAAGERIFDVSVEGTIPAAFDAIDQFATAGAKGAFMLSHTLTMTDDSLDLEFIHDVENTALKGIEIIALDLGASLQFTPSSLSFTLVQDATGSEGFVIDSNDGSTLPTAATISALDDDSGSEPTWLTTTTTANQGETYPVNVDATGLAPGDYSATLTADSVSGYDDASIPVTLSVLAANQPLLCINAGGPAYSATDGVEFSADQYFSTPSDTYSTTEAIANTLDQVPHQTERYGTFNYMIPAPNGDYKVDLYFAEIYHGAPGGGSANGAGSRVMDVAIEGTPVLSNYDIYATAGGALTAQIESFPGVTVSDGMVDIAFSFSVDNAKVSAICITPQTPSGNTPPTINAIADQTVVEGDTLDVSVSANDNDGDDIDLSIVITDNGTPTGGYSFIDNGDGTADLSFPTSAGDAGTVYNATVTASAVDGSSDEAFLITVSAPPMPQALIQVNPGANLAASTFGSNSFQITNTGQVDIVSVTFDLSTAAIPDIAFDPIGTAGDSTAKCLIPDSATGTPGFIVPGDPCVDPFSQPHNGIDDDEGFDALTLNFSGFNTGEQFNFSTDLDPTSIKDDNSAGDAGAISGFELIGTTVTVEFADGSTLSANLFDEGSLGGSAATVAPDAPAAPTLAVDGVVDPAALFNSNQTIIVSGTPGAAVTLLQIDARLHIDVGGGGYDIDPFEANEAMAKALYSDVIGAAGSVNIPITLLQTASTDTGPDGGLNYFIAVIEGAGEQNSATSNTIVLEQLGASVPIAYWPLNEANGTQAADILGGNNLTLFDDFTWQPGTGQLDGALELNGNGYGSITDAELGTLPAKSTGGTQTFTIIAWVNPSDLSDRNPVLAKQGTQSDGAIRGFMFSAGDSDGDGKLYLEVFKSDASSEGSRISSDASLTANQWQHVAVSYEFLGDGSSQIRFYINGQLAGANDTVVGPLQANAEPLELGRYFYSSGYVRYFNGLIDDVRVYNSVLSIAEIQAIVDDSGGSFNSPPTASFTATPDSGDAPLNVAFDASASNDSDGTIVSYAWDFGDGNSGSGVTTSHEYSSDGSYTATLTVTDDEGASSISDTTVTVTLPGSAVPTASFTATPDSGEAPLTVAFDASASSDSDGTIVSYAWDFGDGNSGSGVNANHEYTDEGSYTVTLTVTDDTGNSDTANTTIDVTLPSNEAPTASFATTPDGGATSLIIVFDASASSDSDGTIDDYAWDFGDGNNGSGINPSHEYASAGFYPVTLTVTDNLGASDSVSITVKVGTAESTPIAYWPLNESDGTEVADIVGGNNLALFDDFTWQPTAGQVDGALELNGNGYAALADAELSGALPAKSTAGSQAFTITAWVNPSNLSDRNPVLSKQGTQSDGVVRGFMFSAGDSDGDGKLYLEVFKNDVSSQGSRISSDASLTTNQWQHVAVSYEFLGDGSSQIRFYINGQLAGGSDAAVGPLQGNAQPLELGRYYWSGGYFRYFNGLIDDVRVYDSVLNIAEIQDLAGN